MENNMTRKITAVLAAAVVLTSAGVAAAQTNSHPARTNGQWQARQAPYSDIWTGSGFPVGRYDQRDPLAGSVFDGIAPY
jgi:hypothetical protein